MLLMMRPKMNLWCISKRKERIYLLSNFPSPLKIKFLLLRQLWFRKCLITISFVVFNVHKPWISSSFSVLNRRNHAIPKWYAQVYPLIVVSKKCAPFTMSNTKEEVFLATHTPAFIIQRCLVQSVIGFIISNIRYIEIRLQYLLWFRK